MKAWMTKYALTTGIEIVHGEISSQIPSIFVWGSGRYLHGEGKDWHRTPEAAKARAEQMRAAKIISLQNQIAKLEKISFK